MTQEVHKPVGQPADDLVLPGPDELLDGVLTLSRELHLEMDENALVGRFLENLARLFPTRSFAVRVLDLRSSEMARCYAINGVLRDGLGSEPITIKRSSVEKAGLKRAVVKSARIRLRDRWDSPFPGVAAGFAVPLAASGEFYGVLDVGYTLGTDGVAMDKPLVVPIANHLSVALRNERLHRETVLLRDYQAKLIEHANALILGVDGYWRITICNQAFCRLSGYRRDEVIGRDLRDLVPSDELTRLSRLFRGALIGGTVDSVEIPLVTPRGRVRTVWNMGAIGGHGQLEAIVAVGQDETKIRELQQQVIQAEKLATLGQLAAGVVHELNNPLTSISVYAEYLRQKLAACLAVDKPLAVDEADLEKLRRISAGAQRISDLARDLIQYAKPAKDDRVDAVDVNSAVVQSLSFCEHLFEHTGVSLVEELAEGLPRVQAVPGQLEQVLINLLTNAVQAVEGGGTVTVQTSCASPKRVAIAVADDGPGVPPSERARIFEPFFTTKSDGRGTGLGLSIVRKIVEWHRGEIEVTDNQGGGTVFTVTLPASCD